MQFPVEEIKSSRKVTRPFTPFSLNSTSLKTSPDIWRQTWVFWEKSQTWHCDQKKKCEQERNSVGFWRGGLGSREDWMLHFRTCCKTSGYRPGWQCQSRIHASNSTFPSGHSSSSSSKGVAPAGAGAARTACWELCAPPERAALLPWSSAAGSHPLVLPGWP